MKKPNILFLMTDQQRWDALSCSGDWVKTPNLDRIAGEGVRFDNCVTTTPVCIPARLTMATGRYPHDHGVWNNQEHSIGEDEATWMQSIRAAGYRTSLFGKTHLHPHHGDLRDRESLMHAIGIDDVDEIGGPRASQRVMSHMTAMWQDKGELDAYREDFKDRFQNDPTLVRPSSLPLEDYADTYVGERARQYLEDYQDEKPWFCWVSFGGPHEPWDTPEPYYSMYNPEDMPEPIAQEHMSDKMPERYRHIKEDTNKRRDRIAAMRANYAGNVTLIDDQIGEILKTLEARGELGNTIITLTSDHGEMNGDFGLIYKSVFMNSAVRVPMIVRTPETLKRGGGQVCHSPCEWADLGPTLCELTGATQDYQQFAQSMCSSITQPDTDYRTDAISEEFEEIMIMNKEWKLMVDKDGKPYALFDQVNDRDEINNLVDDPAHADVRDQLLSRINERVPATTIS